MIASTPVARWTWGEAVAAPDPLARCLRDLRTGWTVLAGQRLAAGEPDVRLTLHDTGRPSAQLYRGALTRNLPPGPYGSAEAWCTVPGLLDGGPGPLGHLPLGDLPLGHLPVGDLPAGVAAPTEGLFLLSAGAHTRFTGVELVTYSDAWLPFDLRGRAQPAVHAANAPRLAAVLAGLTEAFGREPDPAEPTPFATPTRTGVLPRAERDGSPSDTWSRFELAGRYREFIDAPGFGRIGYRRTTAAPVRYVPVSDGHGPLGHLWACDAEHAASFEPLGLDVLDHPERYRTARAWLARLHTAHDLGLTPGEAMAELTGWAPGDARGPVDLLELREPDERD
ncbi:hypothetical protein [Streptomyces sp. CBMA123]|uniref:hypothetical protein n=1 Tax=Streptomyces sp. CBMA123 TaxID=1896313 RepID=UPI001661ED39|nr:hypothetical protein [Streptomyces sp. CBMA123]MBD0688894.1 hypothetical protein [Streptomyces sp. CBMA123]